jgi:hypothetical protein
MQQKSDNVLNRGAGETPRSAPLTEEVVAFMESGLSIVMAVVGPGGRALTGRALAVRVTPEARIRLIYAEEGNEAVTASAKSGQPIAATFSAPLSHRTLQLKGFSSREEDFAPEDEAAARKQTDVFAAILGAVGHTPAFVQAFTGYRSSAARVLSFPAQEAYEQTPGPGAGRPL